MKAIWENYKWMDHEIQNVKSFIHKVNRVNIKEIKDIVDDMINSNGKMIRPAFVILGAHFGQYDQEHIIPLASSIEMLHMATLVHDDIIDNADLRRSKQSIQSKYGKDTAVYAGDYLLTKSITVIADKKYNDEYAKEIPKSLEKICYSEMFQNKMRNQPLTFKQYLRIISGKTAVLFATSLYIGAVEGGAEEKIAKQLAFIGYEVGMAFQIIDDILDVVGTSKNIGKTTFNDLKQGYYTLPVLIGIDENKKLKKYIEENDDYNEEYLKSLLNETKGLEKARGVAKKYSQKAQKRIDKLPEGDSKEVLNYIITLLLDRQY